MAYYKVWYYRPEVGRDVGLGLEFFNEIREKQGLDPFSAADVEKTHIAVKHFETDGGLDAVFEGMQAENWSPNGEAFSLIAALDLGHTSMSVGDVVQDQDGRFWFVDNHGFKELN